MFQPGFGYSHRSDYIFSGRYRFKRSSVMFCHESNGYLFSENSDIFCNEKKSHSNLHPDSSMPNIVPLIHSTFYFLQKYCHRYYPEYNPQ